MMELVRMRQQQQNTKAHLRAMEMRLQGTEKNQQKIMSFLAKAMQNTDFVQNLVHHDKRKDLEEGIMNKRRRMIDHDEGSTVIKDEPEEWGMEMSELDALTLEMQGIGKSKRNKDEVIHVLSCGYQSHNERSKNRYLPKQNDILSTFHHRSVQPSSSRFPCSLCLSIGLPCSSIDTILFILHIDFTFTPLVLVTTVVDEHEGGRNSLKTTSLTNQLEANKVLLKEQKMADTCF
ncbi:hypothetical protein L2E82_25869 [Cichorium intybus]|uniref:Uncharacterized protein n=1 Tax=Cichorium intybus TaxID=13427 RepID=A0ACB9E541_CICIN|nr:hypothetical protein L2E82_25869 [Cichorium intybus]